MLEYIGVSRARGGCNGGAGLRSRLSVLALGSSCCFGFQARSDGHGHEGWGGIVRPPAVCSVTMSSSQLRSETMASLSLCTFKGLRDRGKRGEKVWVFSEREVRKRQN